MSLRPANSYYSNPIEGHDTHPLEIARALQQIHSPDSSLSSLQHEALAHTTVQERLPELLGAGQDGPYTEGFWCRVHRGLFEPLSAVLRWIETVTGERLEVRPSELRTTEVQVGRHVTPAADVLRGLHPSD